MTTLVVGASGATGRLLVEQLLNNGECVKIIVRSKSNLPSAIGHYRNLSIIYDHLTEFTEAELREHTKGCHEPGAALCISVNLEAWNSLPEDLQHIVEEAALATSVETLAQFDYFNVQAFTQLKEQGVDFKVFPDDVVAALKQASKEVIDDLAKDNELFKKVYESYQAFLEPATEYANVFGAEVFRQRS